MHYHLEIVMPQTDNVEEAVTQIMKPFDENTENDEDHIGHSFWDFWVIGGRWAGTKLTSHLDQTKLDAFYKELSDKKVTVSGFQCGKQEISPADQIPMVDKLWETYFPQYQGKACPLFNHANNQYINQCLYGDVMLLKNTTAELTCSKIIFAGVIYDDSGLEAKAIYSEDIWNGCNHEKTTWDKTFSMAMDMFKEDHKSYPDEWKEKNMPDDTWLVVTVDYHS